MNEFVVWDDYLKEWALVPNMPIGEETDRLVLLDNGRYAYHQYTGKTDINDNKIYADCSIVEFELYIGDTESETLNAYFKYNTDDLRFELIILNNWNYSVLWFNPHKTRNFKIIDTIQENKLGLIK